MDRIKIAHELIKVARILTSKVYFFSDEEMTEAEVERAKKKVDAVRTLSNNMQSLRNRVTRDLKSEDEKTQLTALVIAIMDKTAERVGNEESAGEDRVGITGLKKKHVSLEEKNKVRLLYVGKSFVEHEKEFTNETMAKILAKLMERAKKPDDSIMVTSDGFKIKADRVNRYLEEFNVTAKDIRGYAANNMVIDCLKRLDKIEDEKERKKKFNSIVKNVAERVGHGPATLRKHYLLPKLESEYIKSGEIMDLKDVTFQ